MPETYSTRDRARLRVAFLAPGVPFYDWLAQREPDVAKLKNLKERLQKGNPRTLHVLNRLSGFFEVHNLYWLEEDPDIVRALAKGALEVTYAPPSVLS